MDDSPRPQKKVKAGGGSKLDSTPSLLSRMGSSISPVSRRSRPDMETPLNAAQRYPAAEGNQPPLGGYSIKGAAKIASNDARPITQRQTTKSVSLLERLNGGGTPSEDGRRKKRERG